MSNNIIFSKDTGEYIPIKIKTYIRKPDSLMPKITLEYDIFDYNNEQIGYVYLRDEDYGCYIWRMKNEEPQKYGKIGVFADKLGVQHCLNKGMNVFQIRADAAYNSHAIHYLRGQRFEGQADADKIRRFQEIYPDADIKSFNYNTIVNYIIKHTPKGERFNTMFLKEIPMYMPKKLIQKYVEELLKNPLIIK